MGEILQWQNMTDVIEPFYPKEGNGRRPIAGDMLAYSLHAALVQNERRWAMEDALYEIDSSAVCPRLSMDRPCRIAPPS